MRFAGRRVAYAATGEGTPLVAPAWWISHVELDWGDQTVRQLWGSIGEGYALVRYDRLGVGMSDREVRDEDLTLDGEVALAEHLPFADGSVDTVVSTFVLCTVDAPDLVLREIARVLQPDGQLLIIEHVRSESPALARWQDRLVGPWRRFARGCRCNRATAELISSCGFELDHRREASWHGMPPIVRPLIVGRARKADTTTGIVSHVAYESTAASATGRLTDGSRPGRAVPAGRPARHRSRAAAGDARAHGCRGRRPPVRRGSRELLRGRGFGRADLRDLDAGRAGGATGVRRALPAAAASPGPGRPAPGCRTPARASACGGMPRSLHIATPACWGGWGLPPGRTIGP